MAARTMERSICCQSLRALLTFVTQKHRGKDSLPTEGTPMKPLAARWVYQITVDVGVALKKHNMEQTLRSPKT